MKKPKEHFSVCQCLLLLLLLLLLLVSSGRAPNLASINHVRLRRKGRARLTTDLGRLELGTDYIALMGQLRLRRKSQSWSTRHVNPKSHLIPKFEEKRVYTHLYFGDWY
jgi:hypothetical protein